MNVVSLLGRGWGPNSHIPCTGLILRLRPLPFEAPTSPRAGRAKWLKTKLRIRRRGAAEGPRTLNTMASSRLSMVGDAYRHQLGHACFAAAVSPSSIHMSVKMSCARKLVPVTE